MATYIKTLKEDNGDITYPQTKAGAVYTDEGSDAQTVLNSCARFVEGASTGTIKAVTLKDKDGSVLYPVTSKDLISGSWSAITIALATSLDSAIIGVINFKTTVSKLGDGFTNANGLIRVGAGVSYAKFSANVFCSSNRPYAWCELYKNGAATGIEFIADTYSGSFGSVTLTPVILPVAEGDVFSIYNREAGNSIRANGATYFTAEQIG